MGVRCDGLDDLLDGAAAGVARAVERQDRGRVSQEAIGWYGGIIFSIFLIGWAVGGVLFGVLADRFGRTKTLVFTILIYAMFTGLAAVSADLVAPCDLPVPNGTGYRRGMGGRRRTGGRGMAE